MNAFFTMPWYQSLTDVLVIPTQWKTPKVYTHCNKSSLGLVTLFTVTMLHLGSNMCLHVPCLQFQWAPVWTLKISWIEWFCKHIEWIFGKEMNDRKVQCWMTFLNFLNEKSGQEQYYHKMAHCIFICIVCSVSACRWGFLRTLGPSPTSTTPSRLHTYQRKIGCTFVL